MIERFILSDLLLHKASSRVGTGVLIGAGGSLDRCCSREEAVEASSPDRTWGDFSSTYEFKLPRGTVLLGPLRRQRRLQGRRVQWAFPQVGSIRFRS